MNMNNSTDGEKTTPNQQLLDQIQRLLAALIIGLCVAGAVGNGLSIYVYTKRHFRRHSINILLSALSVVDLSLTLLAVPVFGAAVFQQVPWWSTVIVYTYPVTVMLQCASVWLLVVITVERWLAVCRPFLVATYCTRRRAVYAIIAVTISTILFNMVRFWEFEVCIDEEGQEGLCWNLRKNEAFLLWYQGVATSVTQFAFPLMALSALNFQVAHTIHKAGERRQLLSAQEKREHRTANMMCHVVLVFVFCYLLPFVLNVVEIVKSSLFQSTIGFVLNDVASLLVITNSASTFLFYLQYSTRYRQEIELLAVRLWCPSRYEELRADRATRLTRGTGCSSTPMYRLNSVRQPPHRLPPVRIQRDGNQPHPFYTSDSDHTTSQQQRRASDVSEMHSAACSPAIPGSGRKATPLLAPPPVVYGAMDANGRKISRTGSVRTMVTTGEKGNSSDDRPNNEAHSHSVGEAHIVVTAL